MIISKYYHTYISTHFISMMKFVFGEEIGDEIEVVQQQQTSTTTMSFGDLSKIIKQQTSQNIIRIMDNLIMDEYIQWFIQNGVEMVLGFGGGIVLYSLPETLFSSYSSSISNDDNGGGDDNRKKKSALVRQRLIHAADPWLERVLFSPGGMWELVPSGWRECCLTTTSTDHQQERKQDQDVVVTMANNTREGRQQQEQEGVKKIDDCLDTTQEETLVGTEISATVSDGSTDNETDEDGHEDDDDEDDEFASTRQQRHVAAAAAALPPMSSVEMKTNGGYNITFTENNGIKSPREESVGDALYATICDVVASNLANAFQSREATTTTLPRQHEREEAKDGKSPPTTTTPSSPQEQIETILHRTTIAATTIFVCQFLSSPTTRRSWMSAIKLLTSAGLFSTAISAGVASHLLRSSSSSDDKRTATTACSTILFGNGGPITMLCSKIIDWIQVVSSSSSPLYSTVISSSSVDLDTITKKVRGMFHRLREEIKKNKRLQATVALLILYGVKKQLPPGRRRRKIRSGGGLKSTRVTGMNY